MASTVVRRPLPALIALVALLLLTALVWWRVLNRDDSSGKPAAAPCPTVSTPAVVLPAPASVQIQVLNSTTRTGIAGAARKSLVEQGFLSPLLAGNLKTKHKVTGIGQIRYGAASTRAATLIRYYLPGAKLVQIPNTTKLVRVVLGPGYRRVASPATVRAALAADHAAVKGAEASTGNATGGC